MVEVPSRRCQFCKSSNVGIVRLLKVDECEAIMKKWDTGERYNVVKRHMYECRDCGRRFVGMQYMLLNAENRRISADEKTANEPESVE